MCFFVGDKEETIKNIIGLVQVRTQWYDFIENILELITVNNNIPRRVPILAHRSFPLHICDISLPKCKMCFVYFLISIKTRD